MRKRAKSWIVLAMVACESLVFARPSVAQLRTQGLVESTPGFADLFSLANPRPPYLKPDGTPTTRGLSCSESIRGNGGRAGYMLSHGAIIPGSIRVSLGARTLHENVDYYLDSTNGMLAFAEPVRRFDTIRASYRYVEGAGNERTGLGMQGLALNLKGGSLSFGFGTSSDKAKGIDFTTYGLSLNTKFGAGSNLSGLLYMSAPAQNSSNAVDDLRLSKGAPTRKVDPKDLVNDHLILQNLNLKAGAASFRATYQDVGQKFNGFQALRIANARDANTLAQLGALERERGVKRMGFGVGLQLGKKDTAAVDWDTIRDGASSILRQKLALQSGGLSMTYATRQVGEKFTRFGDLREDDRVQWAKEKGIKRSDLTLGFNAGKNGAFGFSQSSAADKSGALDRQALNFASKSFSFQWNQRKADQKFNRLGDLSESDKTALALDIRRQFNPVAAAGEVTAKDKIQIGLDAGLTRSQMAFSAALGKKGALAFNQFGISDGQGAIRRQSLSVSTPKLNFNYTDQTIGEKFGRLAKMSDFERTQFANEAGIHRTGFNLGLAVNKVSTFGFTQLSLSDKSGGMTRQGFAYDTKGLTFRLNLANTDKDFSRAHDLAIPEPERKTIESERGYQRMDLSARLTSIKGFTFDTYEYNATNAADKLAKSVYRHQLAWTNGKGINLGFLIDGNRFGKDGVVHDERAHEMITYDQQWKSGMKLNVLHDSLATVAVARALPTVITDLVHIETNRAKPINLMAETRRVRRTDGSFETTDHVDVNLVAAKSMALRFNTLRIDRGKDPSSDTNTMEWKWNVAKTFAFNGAVTETQTNNDANVSARSFGASGTVAKNLNVAAAYTQVEQHKRNTKDVRDLAVSNARPVNAGPFQQVVMTAKYASVTDQHRKQSELSSGRIQAMLGKNQIVAEYGGALDPKGNNAIARTLAIVSDRNEKLPLHFDMMYKARSINHGDVKLVRKYNAALRVDKGTSVTYAYTSLPEDPAGNMQPIKSEVFGLKSALNKDLKLAIDYTASDDMTKKTTISKLGGAVNARLDKQSALEVGVSVDTNVQGDARRESQTVRLSFDHQVDGDHFITIGAGYTMFPGETPNDLTATVDLKTRF